MKERTVELYYGPLDGKIIVITDRDWCPTSRINTPPHGCYINRKFMIDGKVEERFIHETYVN